MIARDEELAAAALLIGDDPDLRILRRLHLREGTTGYGKGAAPFRGVAVHLETVGPDPQRQAVVELAFRTFRYDRDGYVTSIGEGFGWTEDVGVELDDAVARRIGLTGRDLAGTRIDDEEATRILGDATIVVAAAPEICAPALAARLTGAGSVAWVSVVRDVSWLDRGFDGCEAHHLLMQAGAFVGGHAAAARADLVVEILMHGSGDGRPALGEALWRATSPQFRVLADGASPDAWERLRHRGYGWRPRERVWSRDVLDRHLTEEEAWLARHVYGTSTSAVRGPTVTHVDWTSRYA